MSKTPRAGDPVSWNTSQGATRGHVERVITRTTKIKGHVAKATPKRPEIIVKTDRSGKEAIHRPETLKRR